MKRYSFEMSGTGSGGQTWATSGEIEGTFPDVPHLCIKASFLQLTQGKAVYGRPGAGCSGPYHITKMVIEER